MMANLPFLQITSKTIMSVKSAHGRQLCKDILYPVMLSCMLMCVCVCVSLGPDDVPYKHICIQSAPISHCKPRPQIDKHFIAQLISIAAPNPVTVIMSPRSDLKKKKNLSTGQKQPTEPNHDSQ